MSDLTMIADFTLLQEKQRKLLQQLFFYDDVPEDENIIDLVKSYHKYKKAIKQVRQDYYNFSDNLLDLPDLI